MQYLPVFFNTNRRECLVVGAGDVAARKVHLLLEANAQVIVIAPEISTQLSDLYESKKILYIARSFVPEDVIGKALVIAATDKAEVNRNVYEAAHLHDVIVNVVDTPNLCDFTFGAIIDRSPITVAVSSSGKAPVLARAIRSLIEPYLATSLGKFINLVKRYQKNIQRLYSEEEQLSFWQKQIRSSTAELLFAGQTKAVEQILEQQLLVNTAKPGRTGEVYLIGVGPGAIDLLTFRALRLLQQSEVILYDRLISQEILNLAGPNVECIYVGKQLDNHCVPQQKINDMLVDYARKGKTVARLKGGDPFIFGRGGEEAAALAKHRINFQVVPGITSAIGCGAYAGIPLTYKGYAQSCRFITGHTKNNVLDLSWASTMVQSETLVFYMGIKNLSLIVKELFRHGIPSNYPAAVIEHGTTLQQKILSTTVGELVDSTVKHQVRSPALIIIGNVVKLQKTLGWYDTNQTSDGTPLALKVAMHKNF